MVSLWGNKKDDDPESRRVLATDEEDPAQPRISESNERTRLLPPPTAGGREGFLDPDDPAVGISALLGDFS
jgi:hypothetical protein